MRKLRHIFTTALMALTLLVWSNVGWGQYSGTGTFNKITTLEEIEDGYYVIVNSGDQFAMNTTNAGSFFQHTEVTPSSGVLTDPSVDIVWEIVKDGDNYTISNTNGTDITYVSYSGSSNASYAVVNPDPISDNERWSITIYGTDLFNFESVSVAGRNLQYNAGAPRFACYTSNQQRLILYKLAGPDTEAPVPTFFPLDGATGVAVDVNPTITFDEAIYTSPGGVAVVDGDLETLVSFTDGTDAVPHTATISGNVITVVPDAVLLNEQAYTLTVGVVQDEAGNPMDAAASATFTTIAAAAETIELTGDYTGPYYAGDDVTVTWNAANFDNVVVEAWVPSENEGAGGWVPMVASTPAVDGTASFTIPAEAEYSAEYKLRVADAADGDPAAESGTFEVIPVVTIHQIQSEADVDGNSNYVGDFVKTGGIVSAVKSTSNFFVQAGEGAYTGINVYESNHGLAVGDSIVIVAKVAEQYNMTQLSNVVQISNVGSFPTWAPSLVNTGDVNEMYECVLVTVENAEVIDNTLGYGEFSVNDGSGDVIVDDAIYSYTLPENGMLFASLTGPVEFSFSNFKILPRTADDYVLLNNDASLATFTLGGLDALSLEGLVVADPEMDEGATLFVDDFTDFAGIDIAATDAAATVLVELNGTEVVEGDYATQVLADGDVVVATVTAEDATMAYYKVTLVGDNRELTLTAPTGVQAYETGDDIVFTWTSANIDNVNLYAVDVTKAENLINDEPIDATTGTYTTTVPNGVFGTYYFRIADAVDATFYSETADASTITDTQAPSADFSYPLMGETDMPTNFTLMVEFDEEIQLATGNLTVHLASDGTVVATLTEADGTVDGNMISGGIEGLAWETEYYINVTEGMIQDLSGNNLPAITDQSWAFTTMVEPTTDLFFSEYIEGSSSNKAIEIYNPTGAPVDLTGYEVRSFSNGATDAGNTEVLTGTLEAGAVFVIANASADAAILDLADVTSTVTYYNGNDAVGLFKNDVLIDVIGTIGDDPGTAWDVAGVTGATAEHTLVRKSAVVIGNTDWTASAGTNEDDSEWMVFPQNTFTFIGWHGLNNEAEILTFEVDMQMAPATINAEAGTITLEVLNGTDLTTLVPEFTLSMGATAYVETVEQESGVSVVDFSSPVTYVVEAESGTTKDWTVTITEADVSTEAEIISFSLAEQIGPATIDSEAGTIDITVAPGTEVIALVPTIEISLGATISPESGVAQDFTSPVVYTVTAQDLSTTKEWTVTVTVSEIISIYDIQFTPAPSGESPYADEVVTTTGIVTALHYNYEGGSFRGLFIQDGEGAWNGLYVYNIYMDPIPSVGDEIVISGLVEEFGSPSTVTELTTGSGTVEMNIEVISTGNDLPAATVLTTGDAAQEPWEGVLIRVLEAEYTVESDNFGVLGVDDGSGTVYVDDDMYDYDYAGVFTLNASYNITGIGHFSYDFPKILPRFAQDIELASSVSTTWGENITAYPNPFTSTVWIDNAESASRISVVNLIGQQVISITHDGSNRAMIPTNDLPSGVYLVTIVNNQGQKAVRKMIKR